MTRLIKQPSKMPTRKLAAAIVAGMLFGAIQTLANIYAPDIAESVLMSNIEVWVQGAVMVAAGYFTRERAT